MAYSISDRPAVGTRVRIANAQPTSDQNYADGDYATIIKQTDDCVPRVRFEIGGAEEWVGNREMEPADVSSEPTAASPALRLIAETLLKLTVREMNAFVGALDATPNTHDDYITPKCVLFAADAILKAA